MKSYKQITYRYLKGQKNRTLLTILGIILSVAMISAIGTIIVSARGALIKDSIRENGSFHSRFDYIDQDSVEKLINHVGVDESGISKFEGSAIVKESTEEERKDFGLELPYRYIDIKGYDKNAFNMIPIKLKEGRLPENPNELAIEYWVISYLDKEIQIGDKIQLTLGNRITESSDIENNNSDTENNNKKETFEETEVKEFTIVGFTTPNYIWRSNLVSPGYTGLGNVLEEGNDYSVYIKVPDVKGANEKIVSIANDIGVNPEKVFYNNRLLRLYAESLSDTFNKSIMGLLVFVVSLIIVSTIAVIYNAFNISVLERISQFGLLRSVGATPKQIRALVLKEAAILSAIGIPIGLISGVFAMKVVVYVISLLKSDLVLFRDMEITISITVFLISTLVGLITVFLSAIGPARRAGKVSPLEAVRNTGNIKKESFKRVKSSSVIRKLLGIEGEIAFKNLRRNRKRFMITVFSMIISISLFITFSTFSDFLFKMGVVEENEMGDYELYGYLGEDAGNIYSNLRALEDIDRVYKVEVDSGEVLLPKDKISEKLLEVSPYLSTNTKGDLIGVEGTFLITIGDENLDILKSLLKAGNIDLNEMNKNNGVLVINNTYAQKDNTMFLMEGYNLKVGDTIPYSSYMSDVEGEETQYSELNVMGVLEKGILDKEYNYNGSINIITTEQVWNNITANNNHDPHVNMYIQMTKDANKENVVSYLEEIRDTIPGAQYVDYSERAQENRIVSIIISIFLYGFVTLIALISAINIINTISTNIILRTKEIAMIKAVGMTQSGIKRMVALESLYYGIYAAVFGGALGVGLSYIMFKILIGISQFEYKIPWQNVMIACIGATIIALLSGAYPLKRINDKIIVESIKAEN